MTKKQSWIKEYQKLFLTLFLTVVLFGIIINITKEEYCKTKIDVSFIPKGLCKNRLKTQEELDIDDCNNNPREDDSCKCEEYKDNKMIRYYACKQIVERNITNCEQCYEYKQICFKSHPKTVCEKGNQVEEIRQIVNPLYIENCCEDIIFDENLRINISGLNKENVTTNIKISTLNKTPIMINEINKICYEVNVSTFNKIGSIDINKCIATPKFINQTICREKNGK